MNINDQGETVLTIPETEAGPGMTIMNNAIYILRGRRYRMILNDFSDPVAILIPTGDYSPQADWKPLLWLHQDGSMTTGVFAKWADYEELELETIQPA